MTNIIHQRRAERSRRKHPWKYDTPAATPAPSPDPEPVVEEVAVEEEPKRKKRSIWSRKKKS